MTRELDERDARTALDYVDGGLDEIARAAFERRMAAEPELAAKVDALLSTDLLAASAAAWRGREVRRAWRARALVAAAAILALLAAYAWLGRAHLPTVTVALLEGAATVEEYAERHAELARGPLPQIDVPRGAGERDDVDESFLARAAALDFAALDAPRSEIEAGSFFVPIESSEPLSVVVLALPANGAARRLHPEPGATPSPELGRIPAGRSQLPAARLRLERAPEGGVRWRFERGWTVPRGAGELTLLVATRLVPLESSDFATIDRALAGAPDRAALASTLETLDFRVDVLRVSEPGD